MIINIRGTSGSGKSYSVKYFMEQYAPDSVIYMHDGKIAAHCVYYNMMPVFFIGSYKSVCGGCDTIHTQDIACSLVRHFSQFGNVIFEGLLISHSLARYVALYKELIALNEKFVFACLDTPLDVCIKRVKQRRLDRGNVKEFDTTNTVSYFNRGQRNMTELQKLGYDVRYMNYKKDPVKQLSNMLDEDVQMTYEFSYKEENYT